MGNSSIDIFSGLKNCYKQVVIIVLWIIKFNFCSKNKKILKIVFSVCKYVAINEIWKLRRNRKSKRSNVSTSTSTAIPTSTAKSASTTADYPIPPQFPNFILPFTLATLQANKSPSWSSCICELNSWLKLATFRVDLGWVAFTFKRMHEVLDSGGFIDFYAYHHHHPHSPLACFFSMGGIFRDFIFLLYVRSETEWATLVIDP